MSSNEKQTNYLAFFTIGLSFTGAGIALIAPGIFAAGIPMLALGIVLFVIGIAHRKQWRTPKSYLKGDSSEREGI